MEKCQWPGGLTIKPDGINELDPCIYRDTEKYENVTVVISKCEKCGHVIVSWSRQPDTIQIKIEEE